MQLPLPADVLVPIGAGVLVALALLVVGLVVLIRRRRAAAAPDPVESMVPEPPRRTVAHAVAFREADTAPLPVSSMDLLARAELARSADEVAASEDAKGAVADPAPAAAPEAAAPEAAAPEAAAPESAAPESEAPEAVVPAEPEPVAEVAPAEPAASPAPAEPAAPAGPATSAARSVPQQTDPASTAGSGQDIADAVASALANRAAAGRDHGLRSPLLDRPPAPRGDARDRLLAVLLDDPVRTVGAAADLEVCTAQLARLSAAVSHERDVVGDLLARLSAAGLRPDQLASLAGLPAAEVRELLGKV